MSMLETYWEQITLSANAIAELSFPTPKIFTNALLQPHDVTALIRDTEGHERALFTVLSPEPGSLEARRKQTGFNVESVGNGAITFEGSRANATISKVLGRGLLQGLRPKNGIEERENGEIDVEALLNGAERLCAVYPIPGANEKIYGLRGRHEQLAESILRLEAKISHQTALLEKRNHKDDFDEEPTTDELSKYIGPTKEDLRLEEEELLELEAKKRTLEERVSGMEKDLGGLLR